MGLRERIVYPYIVPRPFYIIPTNNSHGSEEIPKLSRRECLAYWVLTGNSPPKDPRLILDGSGGSAKGYLGVGLVKAFDELGIKIDGWVVSSVLGFLGLYAYTGDIKLTEEFSLKIPELLKEESPPYVLRGIDAITFGYFHDRITSLARLALLMKSQKRKLPNGVWINTNNGLVKTEGLENELRSHMGEVPIGDIKNFRITATDYTNKGLVILGEDYPDMPAYRAMLAGASLRKLFAFVMHDGNLLGDSGNVLYFPLLTEFYDYKTRSRRTLIGPEFTTIIAIDLGYEANYENGIPSGGIGGILQADMDDGVIRNRLMTELLSQLITGQMPHDLVNHGDRRHMRTRLITPETSDIPPGKIDILIERRKELIAQGYDLGKLVAKEFRRVK